MLRLLKNSSESQVLPAQKRIQNTSLVEEVFCIVSQLFGFLCFYMKVIFCHSLQTRIQ